MADYQSMYYELLKAAERAIKKLEDANAAARSTCKKDIHEAFFFLANQTLMISDSLRQAELRCEDIYIETCEPDPELDAEIDAFLATPFYPPN